MNHREKCSEFLRKLPMEISDCDLRGLIKEYFSFLPFGQAYALLQEGFIAYPPLYVSGTAHRLCYDGKRVFQSDAVCVEQCRDRSSWTRHVADMMELGREMWPGYMFPVDWEDVIAFCLADLTAYVPIVTKVVWGALRFPWKEVTDSCGQLQSSLINDALLRITLDPIMGSEMAAWNRSGRIQMFNCAWCGGGLLTDRCAGCGARFQDDGIRGGMETPLPEKIAKELQINGHRFVVDPQIARIKEEGWEDWAHGSL